MVTGTTTASRWPTATFKANRRFSTIGRRPPCRPADYPTFSANDSNAAKNTTATFYQSGAYTFTVTMADTYGGVTTSSVNVTVVDTIAGLAISTERGLGASVAIAQLTPIMVESIRPTDKFAPQCARGYVEHLADHRGGHHLATRPLSPRRLPPPPRQSPPPTAVSMATATVQTLMPTGYWKLDEGSGSTAADSSGNGHPGTLVSSPTWTTGELGGGLAFNGTSQYVTCQLLNLNSNTVTISGWVKRNGTQSDYTGIVFYRNGSGTASRNQHAIQRYACLSLERQLSRRINWASGLTVPNGVWTFVALVITPALMPKLMYMQPVDRGHAVAPSTRWRSTARSFSSYQLHRRGSLRRPVTSTAALTTFASTTRP